MRPYRRFGFGVRESALLAAGCTVLLAAPAVAQIGDPTAAQGTHPVELPGPYGAPPGTPQNSRAPKGQAAIPPAAIEPPVRVAGGGYCYLGAHPVDTNAAAGGAWHETHGQHIHFYAPIEPRLFARVRDCYQFTGDPTDFGYSGQTWTFYGAHPLAVPYGGGWCFAVGGHNHGFAPWSRRFDSVDGYAHWRGPYDATFWAYWPYWAAFYVDQYPQFYGGGRFARNGRIAPPMVRLPEHHHPTGHGSGGTPPGAWGETEHPPHGRFEPSPHEGGARPAAGLPGGAPELPGGGPGLPGGGPPGVWRSGAGTHPTPEGRNGWSQPPGHGESVRPMRSAPASPGAAPPSVRPERSSGFLHRPVR